MRQWLIGILLASCAGGAQKAEPRSGTALVIPSTPPEAPASQPDDGGTKAPIAVPKFALERLPRSIRPGRVLELLEPELNALEKLLEYTPETSPDRPVLMRRIAVGYFELFVSLSEEDGETKPALLRAEKNFVAVRANLDSAPSDLYVFGLVLEQLGNLAGARELYASVIKTPKVPTDVDARAHYGLAFIAELQGSPHDARSEYVRARDLLTMLGYERPEDRKLRRQIDDKISAGAPSP